MNYFDVIREAHNSKNVYSACWGFYALTVYIQLIFVFGSKPQGTPHDDASFRERRLQIGLLFARVH